jgi:hypothetical protein
MVVLLQSSCFLFFFVRWWCDLGLDLLGTLTRLNFPFGK